MMMRMRYILTKYSQSILGDHSKEDLYTIEGESAESNEKNSEDGQEAETDGVGCPLIVTSVINSRQCIKYITI